MTESWWRRALQWCERALDWTFDPPQGQLISLFFCYLMATLSGLQLASMVWSMTSDDPMDKGSFLFAGAILGFSLATMVISGVDSRKSRYK
jgi:hypothetical protein